jgi:cell division protein FtsB
MASRDNTHKFKNFLHSKGFLVFFGLMCIFFSTKVYDLYRKDRAISREKNDVANQVATLQSKEQNLQANIDDLKTERGVEEVIRDKFRVVKEGEDIIVIPDASMADTNEFVATASPKKQNGFLRFLKEWFSTK